MKTKIYIMPLIVLLITPATYADLTTGTDFYSNYIWRGTKFGTGPAIQPYLNFTAGGLSVGSWGSFGMTDDEAAEADLHLLWEFDFGLTIGLTDYYYPGSKYFEFSDTTSSHAYELNLGYALGSIWFSANYIINDASAGAGSAGGDRYFEIGYIVGAATFFVGAGDGWHTPDGEMAVCNIGIGTEKQIHVTPDFDIPMNGAVILNPESEQFYVVVGCSF